MGDGERFSGHYGFEVSLGWEMEREVLVTLAIR